MSVASHRLAAVLRRVPRLLQAAYYVYRFFQPKYTVGVVGIVFNDARQVLLVEHVFHPRLPWGLPGGWVDFNEDPSQAVVRELREELGLTVCDQQIIHAEKTQFHHLDMAYTCRVDNDVNTLSRELLSYRYWPLDQLPRLHGFQYRAIMRASEGIQPS
jgi:ADP-ribose pyrophosphatase YjhB (NUDIX family)